MSARPGPVFLHAPLLTRQQGRATLLDAVARAGETGLYDLFFSHDTPGDAIAPGPGATVEEARSVGGAPLLRLRVEADHPLSLRLDGVEVLRAPSLPDTETFAGKDVALAIRNGESAGAVLDWLDWHVTHHRLTGALIVSRAEGGSDAGFRDALEAGLAARNLPLTVMVVEVDAPLGRRDMPPEAHPFCAPMAPGKDRMEVPPPAPWTSPFAEVLLMEWARRRYLGAARTVTNIEVTDLLLPMPEGRSLFDTTAESARGYRQLVGRLVYPWRARDAGDIRFADHICLQFDSKAGARRWCVAPAKLPDDAIWRLIRIGGAEPDHDPAHGFYRAMALRHPTDSVSRIVPKTALIESPPLTTLMAENFDADPVRMPEETLDRVSSNRRAIVTTMKNEGPFILEWIAYHRAIGFDDFLVYTNDCTDGTDTLLDLLQSKGIVQHRDNPFRGTGLKPQHAALQAADGESIITEAEWAICMDVDEYVNIKCGDGTLDALFAAVPDANMITLTWRLFGNADIHEYRDGFLTEAFTRCAPELARKPHQAWGFKTLFRNIGLYKKLDVHRPKGLKPQLWDKVHMVNGSGKRMPREMYRNAWRSTLDTYGYDLVQLNHYAVRSAESFLVKRDRGRVNHVDRDQGLAYWFRMNNNAEEETSITLMLPRVRAEYDRLMADPEIAAQHAACVAAHRAKIDALKATETYANFYADLTGERMQKLSRMHAHFGANVFLQGPDCIPDEVVARDPAETFFFTVDRGETAH